MSHILTNVRISTKQSESPGALFNDNRTSGGKLDQADILCCAHCQCVLRWDQPEKRHLCRRGGHVICDVCKADEMQNGCSPFTAFLDREREKLERRNQLSKAIGLNPPGVVLPQE